MRTTARTTNFTVILLGAGLSAVLIYALTSELFSKNSPTVLYGEACERIKASPKAWHIPLPLWFLLHACYLVGCEIFTRPVIIPQHCSFCRPASPSESSCFIPNSSRLVRSRTYAPTLLRSRSPARLSQPPYRTDLALLPRFDHGMDTG
jgi:hypothetical protein